MHTDRVIFKGLIRIVMKFSHSNNQNTVCFLKLFNFPYILNTIFLIILINNLFLFAEKNKHRKPLFKNRILKIGKKNTGKSLIVQNLQKKIKIKRKNPESVLDFQPKKIQTNGKTIRLLA